MSRTVLNERKNMFAQIQIRQKKKKKVFTKGQKEVLDGKICIFLLSVVNCTSVGGQKYWHNLFSLDALSEGYG